MFLFRNLHPSGHVINSRLSRSATHSTAADVPDIVEVDEEGDIENGDGAPDNDSDQKIAEVMSPNIIKRDGLTAMTREVILKSISISVKDLMKIQSFPDQCYRSYGYTR